MVQLGLAMIPGWLAAASGLISGTTKGTSGFMRKALELSTITAPASTMVFAQALEVEPPAEANTKSTSSKEVGSVASTLRVSPLKVRVFPADRGEAKSFRFFRGKLRLSNSSSNSVPTAPVAPSIATLTGLDNRSFLPDL